MIQIREANLDDKDGIIACNKRNLDIYYEDSEYTECIEGKDHIMLVASDDGEIRGYIMGYHQKTKKMHIISFGVDKDMRRHGIGTKLMRKLEKYAHKRYPDIKYTTLNVEASNEIGIGFYAKYGFKKVIALKDYYGPGKLGLLLGKKIISA